MDGGAARASRWPGGMRPGKPPAPLRPSSPAGIPAAAFGVLQGLSSESSSSTVKPIAFRTLRCARRRLK